MTPRLIVTVALALALAMPAVSCGRKGPPKPPSQTEKTDEKPAT